MGGEGGSAAGSMATEKLNRQLRESAAANPREQTQEQLLALEAEASRRLEHGRASAMHAQEMAREALHGFFPIAMTQWPSLEDHFATISEEGHITPGSARTSENGATSRKEDVGAQSDGQQLESSSKAAAPKEQAVGVAEEADAAKVAEATSLSTTASGREGTAAAPKQGEAGSTSSSNSSEKSFNNSIRSDKPTDELAPTGGGNDSDDGGAAANTDLQVDAQGLLQMQLLKSYFVSRNPNDFSPLAKLVHTSDSTLLPIQPIKALLAKGNVEINDGGGCGWPPLHLALLGGDANLKMVQLLIEHRANLELSPTSRKGQTALQLAAANRQEACLYALIAAGASLSSRDRSGNTPLVHCAAWQPDAKAMRACSLLLDKSADVTERAANGQLSAYTAALEAGNAETAAMLQEKARAVQERAQMELLGEAPWASAGAGGSGIPTGGKKGKKKAKAAR